MSLLVDLDELTPCCADHALESLFKAMADGGGVDPSMWNPHENVFIRRIVELFTSRGLMRIDKLRDELTAWLDGERFSGGKRIPHPRPDGLMNRLDASQLELLRLYLENLPPDEWRADDWSYLVDYLVNRYLSPADLRTEAEWLAQKSVLMGRVQGAVKEVTEAGADAVLTALATMAPRSMSLTVAAERVMDFATARCCENVVDLSDDARHKIKGAVLEYQARRVQGDPAATVDGLKSKLFEECATLNRDWRRIAVTEAGENANQGLIASLAAGTRVKRIEMYAGACGHCQKIDGRVYTVVPAGRDDKDGETQVWCGKTNIGRSASPRKRTDMGLVERLPSERWWAAAGVQHPHCRGRWEVIRDDLASSGDKEFDALLDKILGRV